MIGPILTAAELLVLARLDLDCGLVRVFQGNVPRWCNLMTGATPTVAELLVLVRIGLVHGSVRTRRAQPALLSLRSVVLEPVRGRNTASHVVPLVAALPWPSLDLVSFAGRCAQVASRPRC